MMRSAVVAAALVALLGAAAWPAASPAARGVELTAAFDRDARLGAPTPMRIGLRIDPRRRPSPVTEVALLYPRSIGLVTSGLGVATCNQPASDFVDVIVNGAGLDGCPPNSVMGYGRIVAEIRLSDGQVIPEYGTLALLSGPIERGRLGLVIHIDGQRPFGGRIVLAGQVRGGRAPYGGAITVRFPVVPSLEDVADVALTRLRLTVGDPRITYYERVRGRRVPYRPEGIVLPNRCPRRAFRFRAEVGFEDGTRATAVRTVRCPRAR